MLEEMPVVVVVVELKVASFSVQAGARDQGFGGVIAP